MTRLILLAVCLLLSGIAHAANRIEITGVTGERYRNVMLYLEAIDAAQINRSARVKSQAAHLIRQGLRGLGYYNVEIEFEEQQKGADFVLIAHIESNNYVLVDVLDLQFKGDALKDPEFKQLQKTQAPRQGERMHHGKYEAYKRALLTLAQKKGYFDAKFDVSELLITPGLSAGKIRLYFNSGVRYRFGTIRFEGQQIELERLQQLQPMASGDFYTTDALGKLNQQLAARQWFSAIDVDADPEHRHDGVIDVLVKLTPAIRNNVEVGVGFVTDIGPRLKLSWDKPWLNRFGHSLEADMAVSAREQTLTSVYKMPLADSQHDFYQVGVEVKNTDLLDTKSTLANLKLDRQWALADQWFRVASIRWLHEDYQQGLQQDISNLIMPGLAFRKSEPGVGSMPMHATNRLFSAEIANQAWGAETDFVLLRAHWGQIKATDDDHRIVLRADAGWILQEQVESIPASLRLFAGGDFSIRGYGYQSVAPTDAQGELIGATRLLTASAEYQWRYRGNWWLATFVDAGSAWNDSPDWHRSVGAGVRWASPIGPIRLDLAWGFDKQPAGWRIHLTLGPEI